MTEKQYYVVLWFYVFSLQRVSSLSNFPLKKVIHFLVLEPNEKMITHCHRTKGRPNREVGQSKVLHLTKFQAKLLSFFYEDNHFNLTVALAQKKRNPI